MIIQSAAEPIFSGRELADIRRDFRVLALFAGIGGFELGLSKSNFCLRYAYEIDVAARAVLSDRFPLARLYKDVLDLEEIPSDIGLVTAGFPCVDLSSAGKMQGLAGPSSGLIRHVLNILPVWDAPDLLLENVPFMLRLHGGAAIDEIVSILEHKGYLWAYRVVDVRSFGIPQRRPRVLLFASKQRDPRSVLFAEGDDYPDCLLEQTFRVRTDAIGFYSTEGNTGIGLVSNAVPPLKPGSKLGIASPPAILLANGEVGTPSIADAERLQGFPANWTQAAEDLGRGARWRLVGNAVNAAVSEWVGKRLASASPIARMQSSQFSGGPWPNAAWNVGEGRMRSQVSAFPNGVTMSLLSEFLTDELKPLSPRATSGFVGRLKRSSLRTPPGFIEQLDNHLARVST